MKKMTVGKCLSAITCILGVITFILLAALGVVSITTSVVANFLKK